MEKKMGKEVKEMKMDKKVKMFRQLKKLLRHRDFYNILTALRGPDVEPECFSTLCLKYIFTERLRYLLGTAIGSWRKRRCIDVGCLMRILVWEQEMLQQHRHYLWHVVEAFRHLKNYVDERHKSEVEALERLAKALGKLAVAEEEGNEHEMIEAMDEIAEVVNAGTVVCR